MDASKLILIFMFIPLFSWSQVPIGITNSNDAVEVTIWPSQEQGVLSALVFTLSWDYKNFIQVEEPTINNIGLRKDDVLLLMVDSIKSM